MEEYTNYLVHHGVKGQKWGVRRYQNADGTLKKKGTTNRAYNSTGVRSAIARRKNRKVDASFDKWQEGAANRDKAIEAGKRRNEAKVSGDKQAYKSLNKEYKKALRKNTTYRKGSVRKEVESDLSRKYLTKANAVKRQMDNGQGTKNSQKEYNRLMSEHDIHRAKSRKAQQVGASRSRKKAAIKRGFTMTMKAAAAGAAIGVGRHYLKKKANINFSSRDMASAASFINAGRSVFNYIY